MRHNTPDIMRLIVVLPLVESIRIHQMASLQRTRVNGTTYWRIVESRRINGKPRAIPILQLGTADALLARLTQAASGSMRLRSYQHGGVAALTAIARRLQIAELIDRHVPVVSKPGAPKRPSVGQTMVLAACNRALHPRSKRGWASWAEGTSLAHLHPGLKTKTLTSQFFWDMMHRISLDALARIERDLTKLVVADLGISLDTLFYDTTNFFTYIDSTNAHCDLPQRGHSKQKRSDLRLFGPGTPGLPRWADTAVHADLPGKPRRRDGVPARADPHPQPLGGSLADPAGRHPGLRPRQSLAEEPAHDRRGDRRLCQCSGAGSAPGSHGHSAQRLSAYPDRSAEGAARPSHDQDGVGGPTHRGALSQ